MKALVCLSPKSIGNKIVAHIHLYNINLLFNVYPILDHKFINFRINFLIFVKYAPFAFHISAYIHYPYHRLFALSNLALYVPPSPSRFSKFQISWFFFNISPTFLACFLTFFRASLSFIFIELKVRPCKQIIYSTLSDIFMCVRCMS
jgi:hypothetical protein